MAAVDLADFIWPEIARGRQPTFLPKVAPEFQDGLVGFLWNGPGGPFFLAGPQFANNTANGIGTPVVQGPGAAGITLSSKYASDYHGTAAWWQLASAPLTFACFDNHTPLTATGPFAGYTSGQDGYLLGGQYSTEVRNANVTVGGIVYSAASASTWTSSATGQPTVKALTLTDTLLTGYESGVVFGTAAPVAGAITYSASFSNIECFGPSYWMAVWNKVLPPALLLKMAAFPFSVVAEPEYLGWLTSGALFPTLSSPRMTGITATGGVPTVNYTF